jgi:hemoglobin
MTTAPRDTAPGDARPGEAEPASVARRDLADRDDIANLVRTFYTRAFQDDLIGHIFTDVAHMDLDHHLPIMCDFWQTVLFNAGLYRRNALQLHYVLHAKHPLNEEHFDRWLALWTSTVDDLFAGPVAERAKLQATRIAGSIHRRLDGRSGSQFESIGQRDAPDAFEYRRGVHPEGAVTER